jgi:hypothetical protein
MSMTAEDLALLVLNRGLDDWLYLAEVEYIVRSHHRAEPPRSIKARCFAVVEHLLVNGLADVGDLRNVAGVVRFAAWDGGTGATLREMEQRWSRFGGARDRSGANDVYWLSNTDAGDALAVRHPRIS